MEVEPDSGFMISQKKSGTVYLYLSSTMMLAFPDLDKIGQQLIPLYDIKDQISIDYDKVRQSFLN